MTIMRALDPILLLERPQRHEAAKGEPQGSLGGALTPAKCGDTGRHSCGRSPTVRWPVARGWPQLRPHLKALRVLLEKPIH